MSKPPAPAPITCKLRANTLDGHGLGVEHGLLRTSHVHLGLTSHRHGSLQEAVLRRKSLHTPTEHPQCVKSLRTVAADRPDYSLIRLVDLAFIHTLQQQQL